MGIFKPSRKLVAELSTGGLRTRATVVKIARGGPTSDLGDGTYHPIENETRRKTTIRIPTASGEVAEVTARLNFRLGGIPSAGDDIPVIYDPDDPERVVVDELIHLAEVEAEHGGPTTVIGPGAGEITPGDPETLIRAAGYDPADLLAQAERLRADPNGLALDHLADLHAQGVLSDEQFEEAKRHLPGH